MEVMQHYGVVEKFRFLVSRSSSSCYYLKCPSENCSWLMNSSSLNQSSLYKIKKYYADHTCSVRDRVYARRHGIIDVVAVLIMDKFIDPVTIYTPKDIAEDMLKVHDVSLTYMQAWQVKEKAIKLVRRDPTDLKRHIWWYNVDSTHYGSRRNTEDLKKLSFTMTKAYTIQQFEAIMKRIDQIDPRIRGYLFNIGYSKWSRTYSKCKRTWTMTSNIAESLNNVNMIARRLPVISLLEFMRITIQTWIHMHNEEAAKTRSELTKRYDLKLQKNIALSTGMRVIPSTIHLHVVVDGPKRYIVYA
ncbi:hypothetical protein KY289_030651 [Solanum tuberosum]|nr:hypothetical protein KY289_030651 [Solanum tuberosum]